MAGLEIDSIHWRKAIAKLSPTRKVCKFIALNFLYAMKAAIISVRINSDAFLLQLWPTDRKTSSNYSIVFTGWTHWYVDLLSFIEIKRRSVSSEIFFENGFTKEFWNYICCQYCVYTLFFVFFFCVCVCICQVYFSWETQQSTGW